MGAEVDEIIRRKDAISPLASNTGKYLLVNRMGVFIDCLMSENKAIIYDRIQCFL